MLVHWQNGDASTHVTTVFGNSSTLTATVPAALILNPGSANVTVRSADLASSAALPFTILPVPVLTSSNPASVIAGSPNGVAIGNPVFSPTLLSGLVTAAQVRRRASITLTSQNGTSQPITANVQ